MVAFVVWAFRLLHAALGLLLLGALYRGTFQDVARGTVAAPSLGSVSLGIIVGVGLALCLISLVVEFLRSMTLYLLVFSFGLVVLGPLSLGIVAGIGLARSGHLPTLSATRLVAFALIIWPLAAGFPWALRALEVRAMTSVLVPRYHDAELVDRHFTWGDGENDSDRVLTIYKTEDRPEDFLDTYGALLAQRGWRGGSGYPEGYVAPGVEYWHRRSPPQRARIEVSFPDPRPDDAAQQMRTVAHILLYPGR